VKRFLIIFLLKMMFFVQIRAVSLYGLQNLLCQNINFFLLKPMSDDLNCTNINVVFTGVLSARRRHGVQQREGAPGDVRPRQGSSTCLDVMQLMRPLKSVYVILRAF
jgi:hypothetical protein